MSSHSLFVLELLQPQVNPLDTISIILVAEEPQWHRWGRAESE